MVVYHLDSARSLSKGQVIHLNPFSYDHESATPENTNILANNLSVRGVEQLSAFGMSMLRQSASNQFQGLTNATIEDDFEAIRQASFSQYPSRLQCLYAVENIDDIEKWKEFFPKNRAPIWEIKCNNYFKFDARFLCGGFSAEFSERLKFAFDYWSGKISDTPLFELLIPLPVKTIKIAGYF